MRATVTLTFLLFNTVSIMCGDSTNRTSDLRPAHAKGLEGEFKARSAKVHDPSKEAAQERLTS
jgi:hypothetical protein